MSRSMTVTPFNTLNRYLENFSSPGVADGAVAPVRKGSLTSADLSEILQLRQALEPMIVERVMPRVGRKQLAELDSIIDRHAQIAHTPRAVAMFMELDKRLHIYLAELTGNKRLTDIMRALWEQQARAGTDHLHHPAAMETLTQDHARIVNAIRGADCAVAKEEVLLHLDRTREMLTRQIALSPNET